MKRIFLAVVAVFAAAFAFTANAQTLLPNDPTVRVGKLDNGLTYYIKHNDKPAQRAEFYLATHVGAIQETPDQDGLAHFLEHMCFNGTKNFPGKSLLEYLQSIGANFGRNINAATGVEQTTYMLNNIPVIREGIIDTCLLVLHDYSHFVTNDPAEIDAERGVILEERRTRRTADWRMYEQSLPYIFGDSKYATCTLIGSEENLKTFEPQSLWNFYQTWYRPDLQAVIVVGDIDVDQIEQKIKDLWSDIPAVEDPTEKVMPVIPANEEPLIGIITDPEATSTSVQIISRQEAMPSEYNAYDVGMVMDIVNNLIYYMFAERYNDITSSPDAPFLNAYSALGAIAETCDAFMTSFNCKDGDAINAFKAVWTEIEKARRYGFTEGELERAKAELLSYYERAAESAETRENSEFVDLYITNFFEKYPYMDAENVGIFGASAGGQESLTALLFHGDFYKAAYSSCGCHDNRMDKIWWNEQWMSYPIDSSYIECSNVENAYKLNRPLMIVVGELDDNVDPSSTIQVVNALQKAGKDFELVYLPGERHTMGGSYGEHKRYDFFVKNLLKVTPPSWEELKKMK